MRGRLSNECKAMKYICKIRIRKCLSANKPRSRQYGNGGIKSWRGGEVCKVCGSAGKKMKGCGGKLLFVLVLLSFSRSLLCHNYKNCTESLDVCNDCISDSSAIKPLLKAICKETWITIREEGYLSSSVVCDPLHGGFFFLKARETNFLGVNFHFLHFVKYSA